MAYMHLPTSLESSDLKGKTKQQLLAYFLEACRKYEKEVDKETKASLARHNALVDRLKTIVCMHGADLNAYSSDGDPTSYSADCFRVHSNPVVAGVQQALLSYEKGRELIPLVRKLVEEEIYREGHVCIH